MSTATTAAKPKYKGARITTVVGRASYPACFKPKLKYQSQTEYEYSIQVLFGPEADQKKFTAACDEALTERYGPNRAVWPKNIAYPLTSQQILIDKAKEKAQSFDHLVPTGTFANFKTSAKGGMPIIVDKDRQPLLDESKLYGGCFVQVSAQIKINEVKGQDPITKQQTLTVWVTPYLQGVMVVGDGDPFGGRQSAEQMFEKADGAPSAASLLD